MNLVTGLRRFEARTRDAIRESRLANPAEAERGSVAPMVAVVAAALLLMVGLVYDGGLKLRAAREINSIAAEASRAAGQELTPDVIAGPLSSVDPARGAQAARSYLSQVGASGTVVVQGDTITITTTQSWSPSFTGLFGVEDRTVTGTAETSLKRTIGGTEQ